MYAWGSRQGPHEFMGNQGEKSWSSSYHESRPCAAGPASAEIAGPAGLLPGSFSFPNRSGRRLLPEVPVVAS